MMNDTLFKGGHGGVKAGGGVPARSCHAEEHGGVSGRHNPCATATGWQCSSSLSDC
jgi:hypothetical protein